MGLDFYIGVTDRQWFEFHSTHQSEEVNFWAPGGERAFKALPAGGLFLFKLKSPVNMIVGGGWFLKSTVLPMELAWKVYGLGNGTESLSKLRGSISSVRQRMKKTTSLNEPIGCTLLTECFWLPKDAWINQPSDWASSIVQGKRYESASQLDGGRIWREVQDRLRSLQSRNTPADGGLENDRYGTPYLNSPRLGQAGFRVSVLDAYDRKCAITEEKTLPVLEAAHIRPYADGGLHEIGNGLLLRSDFHTLFDAGYLTIDTDHRLLVSSRIREEFSNGRHYYEHAGKVIPNLPKQKELRPSKECIEWRNATWVE